MFLNVQRGNAMKTAGKIAVIVIALSLAMGAGIAAGQANRPDNAASRNRKSR